MTRERAADLLSEVMVLDDPEMAEAHRVAISALRQQETVTNRNGLNEPLTLGELRSAYKFGCPVWLVGMEDGDGWVFIHHVDSCSVRYARIGTSEEWCFRTKSYGVRVWAYRQKPEEGYMTNGNMIRSMSDEELADFLNQWGTSTRAWQKDPGETLYWLQQTAGEEDKHEP